MTWKIRAKDENACLLQHQVCRLPRGGGRSLLDPATCKSCSGTLRSVYNWEKPSWKNGTWGNLTWIPVDWVSNNYWVTTLDQTKLINLLQQAAGTVLGREINNDFNVRVNQLISTFKRVACDCTPSGNSNCFGGNGTSSIIVAKSATCIADPTSSNSCDGGTVTAREGSFNDSIATIETGIVAFSSFVGNYF
jgi:hypothetical protein